MPNPLRVGLVGTGRIARGHMAAYLEYSDRVQLTAVCDIIESGARQYANQAGVDDVYTDFDEMLRSAQIDAVDICTSHDQHSPQAIAAASAGKHVLVEKAMAHTLQACRDMVKAADKAGVILMVAQNLRYLPESVSVKRLIDDGKMGEIQAVRTHQIMNATRANPMGHWMNDKQAGGGILMTNTIHHVDLLRYYIGNVRRVTGFWKSVQPEMVNEAEDLVAATLEFENGAIGDVFGNWTTSLVPESMSYMVFGSNGTLHSTPPSARTLSQFGDIMVSLKSAEREEARRLAMDELQRSIRSGTKISRDLQNRLRPVFEPVVTRDGDLPTNNSIINEILHFEDCCRTGTEPITSGHDNIETMKMITGIYESSRTGKVVELATL